jgi:hypothetical protein
MSSKKPNSSDEENPLAALSSLSEEEKAPLHQQLMKTLEDGVQEVDINKVKLATLGLAAIKKNQTTSDGIKHKWPEDFLASVRLMAMSEFCPPSQLQEYREELRRRKNDSGS